MENFRKVMEQFKFHGSILLKGFVRTVYGAAVAGLVGFAIHGFVMIESEAGYLAVADFVVSCGTLVVAFANMYMLGGKRGAKK